MANPILKAIVPAAGLGTRLLPATKSQPKEMLPVARKPIVQYVVEELQSANLSQVLLVTGRRKRAIEDHFDPDPYLLSSLTQAGNETLLAELSYLQRQTRFFYTRQSQAQGLGHAVSLGADFVGNDNCVVALGDSLIAGNDPAGPLRAMMKAHQDLKAAAVIAVEQIEAEDTHRYGIIDPQGTVPGAKEPFSIKDIVEKPPRGSAPSTLAVAARYIELNHLKVVCGYQDAYMCSFGGLNYMDFRGKQFYREAEAELFATIEPLTPFVQKLPFVLGFTGVQHASGAVHKPLRERWLEGDPAVVAAYERITEIARMGEKALMLEDWHTMADLMNENHSIQRDLGGSGELNERLIAAALEVGSPGAKLAGAGDGGTIIALWLKEDTGPLETALYQAGATATYGLQVAQGAVIEKDVEED